MSISAKFAWLLLFATGGPVFAQSSQATPSPALAGIAHLAFRVANLDASVAFYRSLGFEKPFELSRDGKVYEAFIKVNDQQFIELYPVSSQDAATGFLHICFQGKDLSAVSAFYLLHGLQPTDIKKAGAGNLLFTMKGPATATGPQNMEYTQYMPGSMHSKDVGQHLGASRIATEIVSVALPFEDPTAARALYLGQAGFIEGAHGSLVIPGGSGESVSATSTQEQGNHGRITLAVANLGAAKTEMHARKLLATQKGTLLTLEDPDGNVLVFSQRQ